MLPRPSVLVEERAEPEPGTEPNLYLLDCQRCGEAMYHLFHLEAEYPLCLWWGFTCGECGHRVDAWEDKPVAWHTARYEEEEREEEQNEEEDEEGTS